MQEIEKSLVHRYGHMDTRERLDLLMEMKTSFFVKPMVDAAFGTGAIHYVFPETLVVMINTQLFLCNLSHYFAHLYLTRIT